MLKCRRKNSAAMNLGLILNSTALILNGFVEDLPDSLFIVMILAAAVLIFKGIRDQCRDGQHHQG